MDLISGTVCPFSHRCRIFIQEKFDVKREVQFNDKEYGFHIIDVDLFSKPEIISQLNPYSKVPILKDRELTLYESNIINEYIETRIPYPNLIPTDEIPRAQMRLILVKLNKEIFNLVSILENCPFNRSSHADKEVAREGIVLRLTHLSAIFTRHTYIMGAEYSLADITLAPLLWRLDFYKIKLSPEKCKPLLEYAQRLFERNAFKKSLTPSELAMR
ncbi:MAG: glutathione S-transferase N-terminal domain-containing protein [Gammaproteobacteria bacterium]|nr:glutathione S-transferase N-terminal domain-containing protein [Gammaproteobacteria bacterium]